MCPGALSAARDPASGPEPITCLLEKQKRAGHLPRGSGSSTGVALPCEKGLETALELSRICIYLCC